MFRIISNAIALGSTAYLGWWGRKRYIKRKRDKRSEKEAMAKPEQMYHCRCLDCGLDFNADVNPTFCPNCGAEEVEVVERGSGTETSAETPQEASGER